jgi:hypothetical protein
MKFVESLSKLRTVTAIEHPEHVSKLPFCATDLRNMLPYNMLNAVRWTARETKCSTLVRHHHARSA